MPPEHEVAGSSPAWRASFFRYLQSDAIFHFAFVRFAAAPERLSSKTIGQWSLPMT